MDLNNFKSMGFQLFNATIEGAQKSDDLDERLLILIAATTYNVYSNVARGLFEAHKLVYSFMLCIDIMKQEDKVSDQEWSFFLRGAAGVEKEKPPKPPDTPWLTDEVWSKLNDMQDFLPCFNNITKDIVSGPVWCKIADYIVRYHFSLITDSLLQFFLEHFVPPNILFLKVSVTLHGQSTSVSRITLCSHLVT